jgi:hypothetical protein
MKHMLHIFRQGATFEARARIGAWLETAATRRILVL